MKLHFFKIFLVLSLLFSFQIYAVEEVKLKSISKVGSPKIIKDRIIYDVMLNFKTFVPKEHWVFFNKAEQKLVIDFYDAKITSDSLFITGTDLISEPEILNIESSMALSGKRAQVLFTIKDGLHYETTHLSDSTLNLQLWRYLEHSIYKNRSVFIIPSIVTLIAAAIVTTIALVRD